jgi:hypothetical protein
MMPKKPFWLMLIVAVLAGFVGGIMGNHLFTGRPVFAQKDQDASDRYTEERADMFIARKGFIVVDEKDEIRAGMMMATNGRVSLYLWGVKGKSRVDIGITPYGCSSLEMYDKDGTLRANLTVGGNARGSFATRRYDENTSSFQLYDRNSCPRAVIGSIDKELFLVPKRPISSLVLFNNTRRVIWSVP